MKEIDWEQRKRRKFDPVVIWNNAMRNNFRDKPEVVEPEISIASEDAAEEERKRLIRSERSRKSAETNLKKDPDYFKKMSAKGNQKKWGMKSCSQE
jgi:hypothetical protein